jgi:hypothetical protein
MAASMMFRVVFWDILPCKMTVDNHVVECGGTCHLRRESLGGRNQGAENTTA